jgi:S1-C subfamily serine protease
MPLTLPDTTPAERKKPPRRSWRHLPASPPVADPLPTPDPTQVIPGQVTAGGDSDAVDLDSASPSPKPRRRGWLVAVAILLVGALLGGTVLALRDDSEPTATQLPTSTTLPGSGPSGGTGTANGSVQDVVRRIGDAVVQLEPAQGVGSGVVFDKSGLILTAHHVVAGTEDLTVKLADGTELPGRVVGRMPERDLAVVAVETDQDLAAAELAPEGTVEVGEPVVAIGSPFGISQTVTAGIVSGIDREIESPIGMLTGLIQTDAPINPGNSGGPLIDADAKVIGINSAIASTSGASAGVGFAVPVEIGQSMIDEVMANGGVDAPAVPDDSSSGQIDPSDPLGGLVPPGLDDLLGSGGDMELLQRLLEELLSGSLDGLGGAGGLDPFAPDQGTDQQPAPQEALGLIDLPQLPEGWQVDRSSINTAETRDGVVGTHEIRLQGPDGNVAIVAERSPDAASSFDALPGRETEVAGQPGKELEGGGLAWMADDDTLIVMRADAGIDLDQLHELAGSIELVR